MLLACSVLTALKFYGWLRGRGLSAHSHQVKPLIRLRPRAGHSLVYARVGGWMVRWGSALMAIAVLGAGVLPTLPLLLALLVLCGLAVLRMPGTGVGDEPREAPACDSDPPAGADRDRRSLEGVSPGSPI